MRPAALHKAWLQPTRGPRVVIEGTCNLGRSTDNQVVIDAAKASRFHAAIHPQDAAEFWLVDLGSRNGTFCNGRRVLRPTPLTDGDRITLADTAFTFRQMSGSSAQAPAMPGTETLVEFRDEPAWLLMLDMKDNTMKSQCMPPAEWGRTMDDFIGKNQQLIEQHGGQLGKLLGDGVLAYWTEESARPAQIVATLSALDERQRANPAQFRTALHHGTVTFGGPTALGEARMIGADVNYIFRMERLASELGFPCCVSAAARRKLAGLVSAEALAGEHEIKGFAGRHRFYRLLWPGAPAA